jgi:two-component system cell cycle response regulator
MADLGLSAVTERHGNISELMLLGSKIGLDATALGRSSTGWFGSMARMGRAAEDPGGPLPSFDAMANAPVPRPKQETAKGHVPQAGVAGGRRTDDAHADRGVLCHLLGGTVYTAENGQEALALALEVMPQIVITDWLMPVMDGL